MFRSVRQRAAALARDGLKVRRLIGGCWKLLSEHGEASGASLAKTTLDLYRDLDRSEQARFFTALCAEFSPDPAQVLAAAQAYAAQANAASLARLSAATEPPRQELFRRLNRAPGGTATILRMRERLLQVKRDQPELDAVDADLRHLLSSWFNPGFLQIVRVDWRTPAYLLEQIIAHEAVHEIQGWGDLRRRLDANGRCFAFFHPALPDEPLIFVEVALTDRMAETVAPLLEGPATSANPDRANTAVFYSISNCQPGLKGISLGNFLIKQVVDLLSQELPKLKVFCTLSPIPGFVSWLAPRLAEPDSEPSLAQPLATVASALGNEIAGLSREPDEAPARLAAVREPLLALCAAFLLRGGERDDAARDPVSRFHLNNGARLERINWLADRSKKGLRESLGLMANYLYVPRQIASHHEKFVRGEVVASHRVRALAPGRGRAVRDSGR